MDLFPVLQNAFLIFGTLISVFLFGSYFAYKHKTHNAERSIADASIAASNVSAYFTTERDNVVHTIAIPETEVLAAEYNLQVAPVQSYSTYETQRRTNYEIINNRHRTSEKVRNNPYTMFR